jgi:DNA-binding protein H-NS
MDYHAPHHSIPSRGLPMKSLVQLQSEIQSLQQQAAELRTREFDRTVTEIVAQMAAFGITLAQIKAAMKRAPAKTARGKKGKPGAKPGRPKAKGAKGAKGSAKGKAKPAKTGTRKPAAIKFRGPNGEAWSGRGKTPTWLKAHIEAGKTVNDFRI